MIQFSSIYSYLSIHRMGRNFSVAGELHNQMVVPHYIIVNEF